VHVALVDIGVAEDCLNGLEGVAERSWQSSSTRVRVMEVQKSPPSYDDGWHGLEEISGKIMISKTLVQ
jgi:hypothetical protein